jgi:hypothetical protein
VALAAGFAAPALAGTRDRVYADSFGNLVIESAAGYKRILVGANWPRNWPITPAPASPNLSIETKRTVSIAATATGRRFW